MPGHKPDPIDVVVGQNIRFQRTRAGMSQERLANHLGLTFQQIQKYEKGTNRTTASRLVKICSVFGIDLPTIFDGIDQVNGTTTMTLGGLLEDPKAVTLLKTFDAVRDAKAKSAILVLVDALARTAQPKNANIIRRIAAR
jgi:transcriptional regulator with XRE-family HTH domain